MKTREQADKDTVAAIKRTEKEVARLEKTLPGLNTRDRKDVEGIIKQYEYAIQKLTEALDQ